MKTKLLIAALLFSLCFVNAQDKKSKTSFSELKKHPSVVQTSMPIYPEEGKKLGISGKVIVEISLNEKGDVVKATIANSDFSFEKEISIEQSKINKINAEFEKAAIDAAMKSKFSPAVDKEGKNVKCNLMMPFFFKLGDKK